MSTACIALHNMMVEKRVKEGDMKSAGFYDIAKDEEEEEEVVDPARDEVESHDAEVK